ncbi:MAG: bifunctional (p)ppGpp synthetase/guanosine-3',5'-bis(diphosphate) 3'-pyrophosphohydrolase [Bacteroidales bacterium]|nr:bifunctional (p)ppGpp synthetase/guanosine-3',5'-bis(diphosphate) 3'-pyrophosphohydrolase [Bacteroidales bacterium]
MEAEQNTVEKSPEDLLVEQEFQALLDDYLRSNHRKKVEIITKAFRFAEKAHRGVKRRSGEPYILHPLAVARICCDEIGLGSTSICSALLHDVVEDTEYTIDDIRHNFGDKIASIVEGLTKISGGIFGEQASTQTENFRRLLLTMAEDIRVVLIKMADRLHNMRTLEAMLPRKRDKIASETLYLYAPLAHRLGLNKIKTELEDLSFRYEHPKEYREIAEKLASTAEDREKLYQAFKAPLLKDMDELGLNYTIRGRVKSVYSIWRKMQTKNLQFDEIYDILAVRIIFESPEEMTPKELLAWEKNKCWDIYAIVTNLYRAHPDRLRDWINHPKANGYQALHTTVMGPSGDWIEVQIRSSRMDNIAERGFAAHWKYKAGEVEEENELNRWILTIKEILEHPEPNAIDMLDTIKMNLFSSEIFVFTPKGEIKTIAQGATALDFAFELHTELGYHCIGAKANHQLVPMSYVLKSGDQIEILTSDSQTPKYEWLQFVSTGKAYAKIRTWLRRENKTAFKQAETTLAEYFSRNRLAASTENYQALIEYFKCKSRDDLLFKLSREEIQLSDAVMQEVFRKGSSNILVKYWQLAFGRSGKKDEMRDQADAKGVHQLTEEAVQGRYKLAPCCQPIPGDEVVGYLEKDGTISVHKQLCPEVMKLKSIHGNNIISAQWATHKMMSFPADLEITGSDEIGVLAQISRIISSDFSFNIKMLHIETHDGIFKGYISLYVHDLEDLNLLIAKLKGLKAISSVSRVVQKKELS